MQTIRAAVCRAFGEELSIEEVTLRAPTSGEVEVAIEAVAICGSDVSYLDGGFACNLPAVFGHEAAGVDRPRSGRGSTGLAAGDPVVVTLIRSAAAARPAPGPPGDLRGAVKPARDADRARPCGTPVTQWPCNGMRRGPSPNGGGRPLAGGADPRCSSR